MRGVELRKQCLKYLSTWLHVADSTDVNITGPVCGIMLAKQCLFRMRVVTCRMLDAMQNPRLLLDADRSIATGPASTVHGAAAEQLVPASVQATLIRPFSGAQHLLPSACHNHLCSLTSWTELFEVCTLHLCLICFRAGLAGQAVQQMWGARWQQQVEEDEGDAWLSELQDADLQPVEVAVQQCFLAPIQERVRATSPAYFAPVLPFA